MEAHYVAGKVMCWVVLERAAQISRLAGFGEEEELVRWHAVAEIINAEVMEKGWSHNNNTLVQRYYSEALDLCGAAHPADGILPADNPRVAGTIAAMERKMTIDGDPKAVEAIASLGVSPKRSTRADRFSTATRRLLFRTSSMFALSAKWPQPRDLL